MEQIMDSQIILDQRQVWETQLEEMKARAAELSQELATIQQQAVTLSGAIEACNVFLSKLEPSDTV